MPPTDASADTGTESASETRGGLDPDSGPDSEDTLELRLPDDLIALFTASSAAPGVPSEGEVDHGRAPAPGDGSHSAWSAPAPHGTPEPHYREHRDDLLDHVASWGPAVTSAGAFRLEPVRTDRDLPLLTRWMNDPAVAAFWELDGPPSITEAHLRPQLDGDGRSVPCLGLLDGTPMSYWEIYRADLDPLARHYPARPHDTGIHLLVGGVAHRGRGLGTTLLRAVADLVLDHRPSCARVIAEPDLRNTPSVAAFLSAGFRFAAEVELGDKRAALMVRDRALRALL
ncbi:GNAT family N-acetyltransferase [Streptomyces sp. NPDC058001]|uniref:GNAT family N-acetyltransferase n=1 Tax=Streptomyces sp. NPDC058001 TaxID=3346300 RepID=UPI0036EF8F81